MSMARAFDTFDESNCYQRDRDQVRISATEAVQPQGRIVNEAPTSDLTKLATAMLILNTQRWKIFGDVSEPCLNMLLELFICDQQAVRVTVTSLCFVSGCPTTTALRYLHQLGDRDLIEFEDDPGDRRRRRVGLSEQGRLKLLEFLAAAKIRLAGCLVDRS